MRTVLASHASLWALFVACECSPAGDPAAVLGDDVPSCRHPSGWVIDNGATASLQSDDDGLRYAVRRTRAGTPDQTVTARVRWEELDGSAPGRVERSMGDCHVVQLYCADGIDCVDIRTEGGGRDDRRLASALEIYVRDAAHADRLLRSLAQAHEP